MAYPTVCEHHKWYPDTSILASPYSCDPTGVVDIAAAIEALKSAQSNTGTVVVPKGTYNVETDLTLPVGMLFRFESDASFVVADGVVLTVMCSLEYPEGAVPFTVAGAGVFTFGTSFPVTAHTLRIPSGAWSVTINTTIPSNVTLKPDKGAIITIDTGVTLTINGPLDAGLYQIFSCVGTGKVVFGSGAVKEVYPEWWGAKADNSTASLVPIQAAVDTELKVRLQAGIYLCSGAIQFHGVYGNILEGMGRHKTNITFSHTNAAGINVHYAAANTPKGRIAGVYLTGPGGTHAGNHGIYLPGEVGVVVPELEIVECALIDWGADCIHLRGATGPVQIRDCFLWGAAGNGITVTDDSTGACPNNVTISGGAIQGSVAGSAIYVDGDTGTVTGLNIDTVDIELYIPYGNKPGIYLTKTFGTVIKGVTVDNDNASLTLGDAVIYIDTAVYGTTFINCDVRATGGLHNYHLFGTSEKTTIVGGFNVNKLVPPAGLGYYCKVTGAGTTTIVNPYLAAATYAANHGLIYDASTYGSGLNITGIDVIREPGAGTEIVFKPKAFMLAKHTTWDPGALLTLTGANTTVTINGVTPTYGSGEMVEVFPRNIAGGITGLFFQAYVSAANTVTISVFNGTAGTITPAAAIPLDVYVYTPAP